MVQRSRKAAVIPQRKPIRPIERQKMRPWLMNLLKTEKLSGFSWVSKDEKTFKIAWRHAARQGWDPDVDADLFERWAKHTGKYIVGDERDPKRWKANFRCALNSLPDVKELKEEGVRKGNDAFKVYQFLSEKKARVSRSSAENKITQTKTKRSLRARNAHISYAKMVDSEGEEENYSNCSSTDIEPNSPIHEKDDSSRSSDCESLPEKSAVSVDCPELPVFDKIFDRNILHTLVPKDSRVSNDQLQKESVVQVKRERLSYDEESDSSSTMTDEDLVQMLLEVESSEQSDGNVYFHQSVMCTEEDMVFSYSDTLIGEGECSYAILPNVSHEIIIQDTPAVRTEQILADENMHFTGLQQL